MADPSIEIDVDLEVQEILLAASQHDIPKLRRLIRSHTAVPNAANVKDTETGYSPLHAAIAACESDDEPVNGESNGVHANGTQPSQEKSVVESGVNTVKFLLQEGAIWNDLDLNNETPGCIAKRIGQNELYEMIVDAGVRAELLLNRLDGYEELSEMDEDEEEEKGEDAEKAQEEQATTEQTTTDDQTAPELVDITQVEGAGPDVSQSRYLDSNLTFQQDRLLDQDQNGVMMAWESDIMAKSAKKILPTPGLRVLNVGHGMGIVDGFLQEQSPAAHHIIEAHPDVVAEMKRKGWDQKPGVKIHEGRWQDILPALVGEGEQFDAIYYDTFAESYGDFREFFSEQVIGLLDQEGKWSFFNGMGADRQISYDVYQKVVEMDLFEAGFDIDWEEIAVPTLEEEWNGVRRPYWRIEKYRLPLCRYMD
ncbi:putative arginine N-methyltransferase [Aspergillus steynii IBT 23096]|uniref:Arginine N-methyltransferase 2 n=1 Tax=Aspergillus steynii IBT 23096 TaxID=1392250 RepID=A0A2I2G7W1_9EURO|nr:putative arginine N-methyltransferase [Aspergillus steynii IBT 23096]PLB48964.1 putative arginine N-methyltransferase [Aspergillus steynii IBT 23096]